MKTKLTLVASAIALCSVLALSSCQTKSQVNVNDADKEAVEDSQLAQNSTTDQPAENVDPKEALQNEFNKIFEQVITAQGDAEKIKALEAKAQEIAERYAKQFDCSLYEAKDALATTALNTIGQ